MGRGFTYFRGPGRLVSESEQLVTSLRAIVYLLLPACMTSWTRPSKSSQRSEVFRAGYAAKGRVNQTKQATVYCISAEPWE